MKKGSARKFSTSREETWKRLTQTPEMRRSMMKSPDIKRRQDKKGELTMRTSSDSHSRSPSSPTRRAKLGEVGPKLKKLIN